MLSTLLWSSLTVGYAQAANIPFLAPLKNPVNNLSTLPLPPIQEWACDIRSWTRAPDLSPGLVTPADARLAFNGSNCNDIVGWQVGLRFKERAIVKLKSKDIPELPVRPVFQWNATDMQRNQADWNDVYSAGGGILDNRFDEELKKYNLAIQNRSLWEVHGAERVVFDTLHSLPLPEGHMEDMDIVESFAIHVPLTNFPPIQAYPHHTNGMDNGVQMIRAETMFEYYHLLQLANGSTIDVPAGRSGFLTAPEPIVSLADMGLGWYPLGPLKLDSPREREFDQKRSGSMRTVGKDPRAPECDEGNLASFTVAVQQIDDGDIHGSNITLNISLTREGNGTEIPAYLDVGHKTAINNTFARNYVFTEEEYQSITDPKDGMSMSWSGSKAHQVLLAKSLESLQEERAREKERSDVRCYDVFEGPRIPGRTRHTFESREIKDTYNILINMTFGELDLPTFRSTFQDYRSAIDVSLGTTYSCLNFSSEETKCHSWEAELEGLDAEWVEYNLPRECLKSKKHALRAHWHEPHKGTLNLDFLPSFSPVSSDRPHISHYMTPGSTGPALSRLVTDTIEYPVLDHSIRAERDNELRKSRYGIQERRMMQFGQRSGRINAGGGWMHAAKLWQKKENLEK